MILQRQRPLAIENIVNAVDPPLIGMKSLAVRLFCFMQKRIASK